VGQLAVLDQLVVVILGVVDDPQDLDEAEGGSQPPQGRLLLGVDLGHGPSRLPPWRIVAAGPEMQVDPAALELELIDLALAVVLTPSLDASSSASRGSPWRAVSRSRTVIHRSYVKRSCWYWVSAGRRECWSRAGEAGDAASAWFAAVWPRWRARQGQQREARPDRAQRPARSKQAPVACLVNACCWWMAG
jgi:hypothetical protein